MIAPGVLSVSVPRVPVKPSTVIVSRLVTMMSPPPCTVPAALSATLLPLRLLVPLPVVICPLLLNCPPAVRFTICPCMTLRLSMAPSLLTVSVLPAASVLLAVNAFTSFSVRLPSATTCPKASRDWLLRVKSPPLNSLPAVFWLTRSALTVSWDVPNTVPLLVNCW